MKVRFTPRALLEAERKKTWWQKNRDDQSLFDDELTATLTELLATPTLGSSFRCDVDVPVRRVLMKKTSNHLYFTVTETEIVILAVWGASRRRGPKLKST